MQLAILRRNLGFCLLLTMPLRISRLRRWKTTINKYLCVSFITGKGILDVLRVLLIVLLYVSPQSSAMVVARGSTQRLADCLLDSIDRKWALPYSTTVRNATRQLTVIAFVGGAFCSQTNRDLPMVYCSWWMEKLTTAVHGKDQTCDRAVWGLQFCAHSYPGGLCLS